ncbi:hypothetical protein JQN72_11255 [Phycicoccus sp. CSK15P-2]|uniref:hypothetical protein n=1 Tax=Phycicoccus sp. CSK15P-2 TaxID=2807627 RepID=UPI0019513C9D|nr:hypothetical protein [Phycicoccus sp. CSK15P-2]MBM6404820.1 hypothetical protein [Phycicoccus sp. CSK15P-2]
MPSAYPTFAKELLAARASLTLADEVGLALRAHRRRLRLSQRAYARLRGYSRATLGRLESSAGGHRLDDLVHALQGTGFALYLGREPSDPQADGAALSEKQQVNVPVAVLRAEPLLGGPPAVAPEEWPRTELIARVRGGSRRFPGHLETTQVTNPPDWWWMHEFFDGPSEAPCWYSPRPWTRPDGSVTYPLADHPVAPDDPAADDSAADDPPSEEHRRPDAA